MRPERKLRLQRERAGHVSERVAPAPAKQQPKVENAAAE
jgi:hypothetical protein